MPPSSLWEPPDHCWTLRECILTSPSPPACLGPSYGPTDYSRHFEMSPQPLTARRMGLTMLPDPLGASQPLSSLQTLLSLQKGLPTTPTPPGGPPVLFLPARPLPALRMGLPTPPDSLGEPPNSSHPFCRPPDPSGPRAGLPTSPSPPNPTRLSGSASRLLPSLQEGCLTPHGPPGGLLIPSQPSGRASQLLLALREVLPTTPGPPRWPPYTTCLYGRASRPLPAL